MTTQFKTDCRLFLGDRPCVWGGRCEGCEHYAPQGTRIVIIKLAAAGDVLRTTSILPPLKRKYPASHVTWVTDAAAVPLLEKNPYIDSVRTFGFDTWLELSARSFDVLMCLDKEPRACALASALRAGEKLGFAMSETGAPVPMNEGANYDYELGLSNEKKFHENTLTYPEIFCRAVELEYEGDAYMLALPDTSVEYAKRFFAEMGPSEPVVGLNAGAGKVFANKAWTPAGFAELATTVRNRLGGTCVVLGGAEDRARAGEILRLAEGAAVDGGVHEILDFSAIVGMLDAVVTGDTLAMHIAVALGVPAVALFGPSAPQEIELYGGGEKLVTPLDCAPCYLRSCDRSPTCMDAIEAGTVFDALKNALDGER